MNANVLIPFVMGATPLELAAVILCTAVVNKRKPAPMLPELYSKHLEQDRVLPPVLFWSGHNRTE